MLQLVRTCYQILLMFLTFEQLAGDCTVSIWALTAPFERLHMLQGHSKGISDLAWASDSSQLCTASDDKTIRVWNSRKVKSCWNSRNFHILAVLTI